ncbi:hypothetical protein D9M71_586080 [compost metagenome]
MTGLNTCNQFFFVPAACAVDIDAARSRSSMRASRLLSSAESHFASSGFSARQNHTTMPRIAAGMPSTTNIHCQPCRPWKPCMDSRIQPDTTDEPAVVIGMASRNHALARARYSAGNQKVR